MRTNSTPRRERVLLIEDDPGVGESVQMLLNAANCQPDWVKSAGEGITRALTGAYDLLITDLRLPDHDGLSIIRAVREAGLVMPMILMTSYSSLDTAIEALRSGAIDYLIKPFSNDDFTHAVRRALSERHVRRENALLRRTVNATLPATRIIGESVGVKRVLDIIAKVATSDASVLIQGESGTGKELVARAIHEASPRMSGPFVPINCGAIPSGLLESELFGHVKGAYTGAVTTTEGLIREAHGGTVFLDEISEMEPALQVKLLRVVQDKQVRPLGARHALASDVRYIAASNRNLKQMMEAGTFRADLYYRLNVINVTVPPLRERGADIELLARHFMQMLGRQLGKRIAGMDEGLRAFLHHYSWPGNVRELENMIERAVILADGDTLSSQDIADALPSFAAHAPPQFTAEALEKALSIEKYIEEFVRRYQHLYNEAELARLLGMGRKALWVRRNRWGLKRAGSSQVKHERVSK